MTLVNPGNRFAPSYKYDLVSPKFSKNYQTVTQIENTATSVISQDLIDAIIAGVTQITRRVEFYEADGITPWNGTKADTDSDGIPDQILPRVISGSVPLSNGSDTRRSLDLVIDNTDRKITLDPDGGLWYDKIVKVFRGVEYQQQRRIPKTAVVNQGPADTNRIGPFLGQIGLSDIQYFADPPAFSDVTDYDVLVAYSPSYDFDAVTAALLLQAFNAGKSVLTLNAYATPATVPLIASANITSGDDAWTVIPPFIDAPWKNAFQTYTNNVDITEPQTIPTALSGAAFPGTTPDAGRYSSAYMESQAGGRWFHYHPDIQRPFWFYYDSSSGSSEYTEEKKFLRQAAVWLFNYKGVIKWETQIGEFVIDRITAPRFPRQIQITGRDYSKRLDLSKFLSPTTYASGTPLSDVIQALAFAANVTKINITISSQLLTADAPFDRATSRLDAINTLASTYNFEWFFDKFGTLIVRDFQDPATSAATLRITTGSSDGNLIDYNKQSDDTEMYNHIIVTGTNSDGTEVYKGEAINNDDDSPTSVSRVGDRPYFYTSEFFTSDAQCQAYADSLLAVKALEAYQLDFDMLVFPWIEVGEILEFQNSGDTFPTRFLFTDGGIPLDLSPMSGTGKRVALVIT